MNIEMHCVGYLYIMELINVRKMEIIKIQRNLNDKVFPHSHSL